MKVFAYLSSYVHRNCLNTNVMYNMYHKSREYFDRENVLLMFELIEGIGGAIDMVDDEDILVYLII
jgi:hypothetical protein